MQYLGTKHFQLFIFNARNRSQLLRASIFSLTFNHHYLTSQSSRKFLKTECHFSYCAGCCTSCCCCCCWMVARDRRLLSTLPRFASQSARCWEISCQWCFPNVRWVVDRTITFFCIWSILALTAFVLRAERKRCLQSRVNWQSTLIRSYLCISKTFICA